MQNPSTTTTDGGEYDETPIVRWITTAMRDDMWPKDSGLVPDGNTIDLHSRVQHISRVSQIIDKSIQGKKVEFYLIVHALIMPYQCVPQVSHT